MSEQVRKINEFTNTAFSQELDEAIADLNLTERQKRIFDMKYRERHDIGFIADTLGCCTSVIDRELKRVRWKLAKKLGI